jgi:hypothetical protein
LKLGINPALLATAMAFGLFGLVQPANAATVVQVSEGAFVAGSGLITFSEVAAGTVNPVYAPALFGGGAGSPTVTFGGFFSGQSLVAGGCNGGAASGCVGGSPTGPITLDPASPATFTTNDGSAPRSPVLSGTPTFNGPIAIKFSTPQSGVGLVGGFFNAIGGTAITAYDINGNAIGSIMNDKLGLEFLGLVTNDSSAVIAALLFSLVGPELAGFAVDDIRFGVGEQVIVPGVPLPGALPLFATGLVALGLVGCRRKRKNSAAIAA